MKKTLIVIFLTLILALISCKHYTIREAREKIKLPEKSVEVSGSFKVGYQGEIGLSSV